MSTLKEKLVKLKEPTDKIKQITYTYTDKKGKKREKSYPYIPYNVYKERMDSVFGCCGYHTEYSEPQYMQLQNGQEIFSCKCRITLIDENGKALLYKEGDGCREIMLESNGKCSNLKNLPYFAQQNAFKSACKEFSIFGYDCVESCDDEDYAGDSRGGESGNNKAAAHGQSATSMEPAATEQKVLEFYSEGSFFDVGSRDGKPILKLAVREKVDSQLRTELSELIFYPNCYKKEESKINRLQADVKVKSVFLRLCVKESGIRDGKRQYVFNSFVS